MEGVWGGGKGEGRALVTITIRPRNATGIGPENDPVMLVVP